MTDNPNDRDVTVTVPASWLYHRHLTALADNILHHVSTVPDSIDLWKHHLTAYQLLILADLNHAKINMSPNDKAPTQASVRVILAHPEKDGANITYMLISNEVDSDAVKAYTVHNEECLAAPTAGTDPLDKIFDQFTTHSVGIYRG